MREQVLGLLYALTDQYRNWEAYAGHRVEIYFAVAGNWREHQRIEREITALL